MNVRNETESVTQSVLFFNLIFVGSTVSFVHGTMAEFILGLIISVKIVSKTIGFIRM